MNNSERINSYLIELYNSYKILKFDTFVDKCFNYNIKIGDYKKNISSDSLNIINKIKSNFSQFKFIFNDSIFYYELVNTVFSDEDNPIIDNNIIIDIPVFLDNYEFISLKTVNFCLNNKINFKARFNKYNKNTIFQLILSNIIDAKKIIEYFDNDSELLNQVYSRTIPFLYNIGKIGIYYEYDPFSFKNMVVQILYVYFYSIEVSNNINNISLNNFCNFVHSLYHVEKNPNKKRMLLSIYNYYITIIDDKKILDNFDYSTSMNIGSYNSNDYKLCLDEEKNIYFKTEYDEKVVYGDEDYLNIVYSKYYEMIIKRNTSMKYYSLFYNLYNDIISNNFNDIEKLLTLTNDKMDSINKKLIILSSGYFAYKKMNISINTIYRLLDKIITRI